MSNIHIEMLFNCCVHHNVVHLTRELRKVDVTFTTQVNQLPVNLDIECLEGIFDIKGRELAHSVNI